MEMDSSGSKRCQIVLFYLGGPVRQRKEPLRCVCLPALVPQLLLYLSLIAFSRLSADKRARPCYPEEQSRHKLSSVDSRAYSVSLRGKTVLVHVSLIHQQRLMSGGRQRCCPSKWCSGPGPPPNAERSLWVWEGLHGSDDHARLLGLLHQNTRGGQQQESWCQNPLWKIQSPTFSGPGPLQWVDLTTDRTR